jgi:spermidine synthase
MAILWMKTERGTRYEVRNAGSTLRLYTNGVFHSQFNPKQPVTGSVWDLLLLPAFLVPPGAIRRVLVLGVGGGAVIRQLEHFLSPGEIVGVELNPVHLKVAQCFFGVDHRRVELHQADASDWVRRYRGEPFDLIIDDLYGEEDGEPIRGVAADAKWVKQLLKRLSAGGVLVSNFVSSAELRSSAYLSDETIRKRFAAAFQLTTPLYENVVGAFLGTPSSSRFLRERLKQIPQLDPSKKGCRLRYSICSLN